MASRSLSCPRCGSSMEAGYVIAQGYGKITDAQWVAGEPEERGWFGGGLKLWRKERRPVTTYRCQRCGYLESYA